MMKLKKGISVFAATALAMSLSPPSKAAVIAVVDSGTDIQHPELSRKIWNNPGEVDDAVDNDDNGYIDDIHGWNFAGNDDLLVNRKLIGTFSPDVYKYFEIQTKALTGQATAEDLAWMKAKLKDQNYLQSLQKFGNFVHGTHVAGISSKDSDRAKIMTLRMIGGADSVQAAFARSLSAASVANGSSATKEKLIYLGLNALAMAQGKGLAAVGDYIAAKHPRVANCSFGASRASIEPLIKPIIEKILGGPISSEELHKYSDYFMNKTVDAMKKSFVDPGKKTLFVFAAGNDGTDNDVAPTAPANVKTDNAITVAATLGQSKLASFSNYGGTMVDIAAPGVGILSTIPGNDHIQLSGTSQAAPFVTNLAGKIIDANPKLSVVEVKKILMETVDKKAFLANKVRSEGIANPERALHAAILSTMMPVDSAITKAKREVSAMLETLDVSVMNDEAKAFVLPLPNFIR